jgi:hypothetical protein
MLILADRFGVLEEFLVEPMEGITTGKMEEPMALVPEGVIPLAQVMMMAAQAQAVLSTFWSLNNGPY